MIRVVLLAAGLALPARAADWPGWRGADRTGVSSEKGLLPAWPKAGPPLVWKATGLGGGYSTPSVAGGRVFLLGSKQNEEFLFALEEKTGQPLWSLKLGKVGENTGPAYPGPRCTPTVDGERVFALGSDGDLVCAATASGKELWRKQIEKEFAGNRGTWAYCESPLIDGDLLICTPGGEEATLVALKKSTGAVVWKSAVEGGNQAAYASVVAAEAEGGKQYVQFLGSGVVGVAAKDGRFLWKYKKNVGGISAMTPVVYEGHVFTSSAGQGGAGGDALLKLVRDKEKQTVREVYLDKKMMSFHGGVVKVGDYLYGTGRVGLVCLEFRSGQPVWQDRCIGQASIIAANGCLYLRNDRGEVALVEATPQAYREKGRFQQPGRSRFPTFCHPVIANGRLYLRDEDVIYCCDIKKK